MFNYRLLLILLFSMAPFALAQDNQATLDQHGEGNAATVIQGGSSNQSKVTQYGDRQTAVTRQNGVGLGATIHQTGKNNMGIQDQSGLNSVVYIQQTNQAFTQNHNFARQEQQDAHYSKAEGYQVLTESLPQSIENSDPNEPDSDSSSPYERHRDRFAAKGASANAGQILIQKQEGDFNRAYAYQEGNRNIAEIHQKGEGNNTSHTNLGITYQIGYDNYAYLLEEGQGIKAGIYQQGNSNEAYLLVNKSTYNYTISYDEYNTADYVTDTLTPLTYQIYQIGNDHQLTITENSVTPRVQSVRVTQGNIMEAGPFLTQFQAQFQP